MKALALLACLALQACSTIVMPTVAKLNTISTLEADPAGFEISIDMPDGVEIPTGGATITMNSANSRLDQAYSETYALQLRSAPDGQTLFRIHPDDVAEIRVFQARAKRWEAEEPEVSTGAVSVFVNFCKIGDGPRRDDRFSVSVRAEVDGPFMPLIRNAKVADAVALADDDPETKSICP